MRAGAELEHALHVLRAIDVEREQWIVDHCDHDSEPLSALDEHARAVEHAERGLEDVWRSQRERVRSSVLSRGDGDRVGRVAEQVERLGPNERAIGHHDEGAVGPALRERHGDCRGVAAPRVDDDLDAVRCQRGVGCHHEDALDGVALLACGDDVREHRLYEAGAQLDGEKGSQPLLCGGRRVDRNDREHRNEHTLAGRLTVLCGGLGGSRLVDALSRSAGPERVTAIGNVGDDLEILGLHVSPDLDTVLYTLAGLLDEARGWGVRDESYRALEQVGKLGGSAWFTLGDRDLGLHLARTERLRRGEALSAVTAGLAHELGIAVRLLPATDDPVRTKILTDEGELEFQEWFVGRRHADPVRGVRYVGARSAAPAPGVVESIAEADVAVIAPSNPFVSIRPILAVPGVEEALRARTGPVAAVSPLVGGRAIRGPLAGMMDTLGCEPTAIGVARLYAGLVDVFVLDHADAESADEVSALGMRPVVCQTVMVDPGTREGVGRQVLQGVLG